MRHFDVKRHDHGGIAGSGPPQRRQILARVGGPFRSVFVGASVDAFSRKVLRVCVAEPTTAFAVRLLREAVLGRGRHRLYGGCRRWTLV